MAKEEAMIVDTARVLDAAMKYLLAIINMKKNTHREQLMLKSMQAIAGGETAFYSIVSNEDAREITKILEERNIPFFTAENGENTTIFVQERYVDTLHEVEEMYQFTNLEHFKQCNGLDLAQSLAGAYDNIPVLHYDDQMMANLAVQKLFNSGITCAVEENKDGSFDVIMHPNCMYHSGAENDFNGFQLQMAYESVRANGLNLRIEQAAWDMKQIDKFSKAAAEGKTVIFADYDSTRCDNSMKIKAEDKRLYIMEEGEKHWKEISGGEIQNMEEVRNLCSAYAEKIENNTCFEPAQYKSLESIGRELKKTEKNTPEFLELREKELAVMLDALGGEEAVKSDKRSLLRPPHDGNHEEQRKVYNKNKKVDKELQDMLAGVQKDAGRKTQQQFPNVSCVNPKQTMQALEYEKGQIINILKAGLEGNDQRVVNYVGDNKDRRKQIENIINTLENGDRALPKVSMVSLGKQLSKELNRERRKEKEAGKDLLPKENEKE
ncbi:MAG: hypothetical protein IKN07_02115 [Lachnospiraceae bacterium]|nr:hypothetical protein [Lachnospiraceae bacterium]MBR3734648.1 hypothetical protein [Lachnospiraceae bacterium]